MSQHEVEQVIGEIEPRVSDVSRGVVPGERHYLLANKSKRLLQLFDGDWCLLKSYPFTGFSGKDGPKRKEGDGQIPEGVYRITLLNPQSRFHLSLRLDYPNALDRLHNGENPGSDIYIHGGHATIGCIPLGDPGIEDVFYAVHRIGIEHVQVFIYSVSLLQEATDDVYEQAIRDEIGACVPARVISSALGGLHSE